LSESNAFCAQAASFSPPGAAVDDDRADQVPLLPARFDGAFRHFGGQLHAHPLDLDDIRSLRRSYSESK
jgi:hypothetical protein